MSRKVVVRTTPFEHGAAKLLYSNCSIVSGFGGSVGALGRRDWPKLLLLYCYIVSGFGGLWVLLRPAIGRNRRPKGALSKWPLWVVGASARGDWQTIGAINRRHKKCTVIGCHIMSASA